jgi:hypothetical protein
MSLSTQKLKALQMICGIPMIIALIIYLYMDWKLDYKGIYYDLTKGILECHIPKSQGPKSIIQLCILCWSLFGDLWVLFLSLVLY